MNIENLPLNQIKPYERNPRKNDTAVNGVAESIKQFGFRQPIVVDKDGVIVAGHTRYKAAKKLGLKEVPCVRADDLTPEQVKAYRIADNKLNELATWDFELLNQELTELSFDFTPFDLDLTPLNLDDALVDALPPKPQEVPAPQTIVSDNGTTQVEVQNVSTDEPVAQDNQTFTHVISQDANNAGSVYGRLVIVYKREEAERLAEFLGIDEVTKFEYTLEELYELQD